MHSHAGAWEREQILSPSIIGPRITTMTKEEAIEKAKQIAEEENWQWLEPSGATYVTETKGWIRRTVVRNAWRVTTNAGRRGGNINIIFDADTGEVIGKAFARH